MKKAQILVELMVAMGMLAIFLPALTTGLVTSSSGKAQNENHQQATLLLQEEIESLDVVRNAGWSNIATGGTFHTVVSGNTWALNSGVEAVSFYHRWIDISSVNRLNGAIVTTGGTLDPSTKKVVATVSWDTPLAGNVTTTRYFTRYMDNFSQTQTTQADFDGVSPNLSTKMSVATTNSSGGEVVLSGGGHGDWCQPALTQWGLDLSSNAKGKAVSAIQGRAFVVTGDNASAEPFYDISITNTYPPVPTFSGSLTTPKRAYGVFGDQYYAYIATASNKQQGTIIDLSNHQEIGYLNIGSASKKGRSITVNGNYVYLSDDDKNIYIFDITNDKTGTKTPLTSIALTANAVKLVVVGSNLYAAVDATSNQFVKIPLNSGGSSFGTPVYKTVSGQNGRDLFINSSATRAYLATATSTTQAELFVIDIPNNQVLASQDTSGMDPHGVIAVTNNKVIIVGTGGYEYQVYNYNDVNKTFSSCSGGAGYLNFDYGVMGISSVIESDGDAYSYIITEDPVWKFKIIEGGPSGMAALSGTFTSNYFDAGNSTAFNRLSWTADIPTPATSLQFQVAVADPGSSGCSNAAYEFRDVDPITGTIPLNDDGGNYQNPGQCFKYKANFTTDNTSTTPTLYDVTWGYSP